MQTFKVKIQLPNIGEVTFFADYSEFTIENSGIGSYEYFGFKGYDKGEDYLHLETLHWDKNLYTDEQNNDIFLWTEENAGEKSCPYQKLCDEAEKTYFKYID